MMNNSLIEELRQNREIAPVAYTKFILSCSLNKYSIYCFFEGDEDKRYYRIRIKKEFENFTCGGKDNVKKVFELINNHDEYKSKKTLFFTDKDYSKEKTINNIYVTPCYSIENFYSNADILVNILQHEFNLKTTDNDYQRIIRKYQILQKKFHEELLIFNTWLACQNDIRTEKACKTYLSIDDTVKSYFQGIVKKSLVGIKNFDDLKNITFIEKIFPEAPKIEEKQFSNKIKKFQEDDYNCIFRGKFEIKFMISFLQQLKNEIGRKSSESIFECKQKCTLEFKSENIISTLSQYAVTPTCLENFIRQELEVA
ncbi:MAG: DUF4435 domain-containing protein [Candidatus Gracilibacteria bacterium]